MMVILEKGKTKFTIYIVSLDPLEAAEVTICPISTRDEITELLS